jgi:hypothetical protein
MEVGDRNLPATVRSTVQVPQMGERLAKGDLRLPSSSREADFTSTYARLGQRRWPLVLGYPWRHEEHVVYQLPAGARIVHGPSARTIESPFGQFTLAVEGGKDGTDGKDGKDRNDGKDGGSLEIITVLVVTKNRIEPSNYAGFRAFLRDIDAALAERVVVGWEKAP